jgi:hypothetical protein
MAAEGTKALATGAAKRRHWEEQGMKRGCGYSCVDPPESNLLLVFLTIIDKSASTCIQMYHFMLGVF